MAWEVASENSSYWTIADKLEGLCAPTQELHEVAYSAVCKVTKHRPGEKNKNLILAAPDLLAALEAMVRRAKSSPAVIGYDSETYDLARAALAKAKGE